MTATLIAQIAAHIGASTLWASQQQERAEKIARAGNYFNGIHDAWLSQQQREMLQLAGGDSAMPFTANYMRVVVASKADRCNLQRVDVAEPEMNQGRAGAWFGRVLNASRIDSTQTDLWESAVRDGDAYLIVAFDEALNLPRLIVEPAFDGYAGVIGYYADGTASQMTAAARVWQIAEGTRVNLYFADRVERYFAPGETTISAQGTSTTAGALLPWTPDAGGEHIEYYPAGAEGLPVFHIPNGGTSRMQYGASEIASVMPLQDMLNRVLVSWVMALEYSGFPILVARGFQAPNAIKPGTIISVNPNGLDADQVADFSRLEAGDLSQFPVLAQWLTGEIGKISRTPAPEFVAPTASGEARKQAEAGLIGKVLRFTRRAGNVIENALAYAWQIAQVYAVRADDRPPEYDSIAAVFRSPELRDEAAIVANVVALYKEGIIGQQQALRMAGQVYGWDDAEVARIVEERLTEQSQQVTALAGIAMPAFGSLEAL